MTKSERFTESLYETMITTAFARIVDKHEVTLASTLNRLTSAYMSLEHQAEETEKQITKAKLICSHSFGQHICDRTNRSSNLL